MAQSKPKNKKDNGIEQLLSEQTSIILQAADERLAAQDQHIEARFYAINRRFDAVDKRIEEQRFMEKLNSLTSTLDHFLKRLTDTEQEFIFMKNDMKRIKAVLREKLGVAIE